MRFVSCGFCGVLLDQDVIVCPEAFNSEGEEILANGEWCNSGFEPIIQCPCCHRFIFYDSGAKTYISEK
jgi:hypothetical protein